MVQDMTMAINVLENGVEIEGTITFSGDLMIDCKVTGEIKSEKGNLTVNPNSDIKGDVKAGEVTIHGKVEGSVTADVCKLESNADIKGDISYKTLGVEPGAKLEGSTKILS